LRGSRIWGVLGLLAGGGGLGSGFTEISGFGGLAGVELDYQLFVALDTDF
jgi:hypothetical protein